MKKHWSIRLGVVVLLGTVLFLGGCRPKGEPAVPGPTQPAGAEQAGASGELKLPSIARRPPVACWPRKRLESFPPAHDPDNPYTIDLRFYDLAGLDLKDRLSDLLLADFDSQTSWPAGLPASFDPARIMELGKNPGLGVRSLHAQGVTGKGVGIGIIDKALLVEHVEYADRLRLYEEIHCWDETAQMHGPAVASIAVGHTVGVAPEADLYYIAETHLTRVGVGAVLDLIWVAKSIDRLLEVNAMLPADRKIRAISISLGLRPTRKGYGEVEAAVKRARQRGVIVISTAPTCEFFILGLDREPLRDPDELASYGPGMWLKDRYNQYYQGGDPSRALLVPMGSRCFAAATGVSDYSFDRMGGASWAVPYVAGLYALACQVKPAVTPEEFWEKALKTGRPMKFKIKTGEWMAVKMVDPVRLMEALP